MSGITKLQRVNLQIIKTYKLQRHPIISICLDHQEGNERLYFGTCEEPSNRLLSFHDLNLFVNKAYYFVHRNTQEVYQGLIPIMYYAFYRNTFTNMTFLGPPGITQFILDTRYFLGVRYLAFAAMDLRKDDTIIQKFGAGNKTQFLEALKDKEIPIDLYKVNKFIYDKTCAFTSPFNLKQNGHLSTQYFNIVPLYGLNQSVLQYLVLFKVESHINYQLLREQGIGLGRIPEIQEGKFMKDGKNIPYKDILKQNSGLLHQAILLLDLKETSDVTDFSMNSFGLLQNELLNYQNLFHSHSEFKDAEQTLIVVHYGDQELLESKEYIDLIDKLSQLPVKLVHIITSQQFYQKLDKESEIELRREQQGYYFLDYLKCMKQCLPKLFEGSEQVNQFKENSTMKNLETLWINQLKYLPMRMKTIQISKGELFYENLNVKRSICYSLKNDLKLHLQRLHNLMQYQSNQDINITYLGTASSIETQSRSASCIYLNLKGTGILLDCGQNSLCQFYFSCNDEADFKRKISMVKIIYISHFHNDHQQGLFDFIKEKCSQSSEMFYLLIPQTLLNWCHKIFEKLFLQQFGHTDYSQQIKIVLTESFVLLNNQVIQTPQQFNINNLEADVPEVSNEIQFERTMNKEQFLDFVKSKGFKIELDYTSHCAYSTAIKFTLNDKSVIYSSDRLGRLAKFPSRFLQFAKSADILIHECTYPDEMMDKAYKVKHSTFLQALFTGYSLKIPTLVLTHFTERSLFYMKSFIEQDGTIDRIGLTKIMQQTHFTPQPFDIDDLINYLENNVIFANDFMTVGQKYPKEITRISRVILKSLIP